MAVPGSRSYRVGGSLYHIIFRVTEGVRLVPGNGKRPSEPITVVECQILGETLAVLAEGRALKAAEDIFSDRTGTMLSLARALDDVGDNWEYRDAYEILFDCLEAVGVTEDELNDMPTRLWKKWQHAPTHAEAVKIILDYLDGLDAADLKAARRALKEKGCNRNWNDIKPELGIPRGIVIEGISPSYGEVNIQNNTFVSEDVLAAEGMSALCEACDGLVLNDQFRRDAARLGVKLDNPTGCLTMRDLFCLYHATLGNSTLAERYAVNADALIEVYP